MREQGPALACSYRNNERAVLYRGFGSIAGEAEHCRQLAPLGRGGHGHGFRYRSVLVRLDGLAPQANISIMTGRVTAFFTGLSCWQRSRKKSASRIGRLSPRSRPLSANSQKIPPWEVKRRSRSWMDRVPSSLGAPETPVLRIHLDQSLSGGFGRRATADHIPSHRAPVSAIVA